MLIGDTSLPEALGSKLLRGAKTLEAMDNWEISVSYHSPAVIYSPSMRYKSGKMLYRLTDKRSWEWWEYQKVLQRQLEKFRPHLTLVTGILPLQQKIFDIVKSHDGKIINYLTDDPWNPIHRRRHFIRNLSEYNHIFSTKRTLQSKLLNAGARSTSWLPFAYDPTLHYPVKSNTYCDVLFIGTGAKERWPWLEPIAKMPKIGRHIYGNSWNKIKTPGWEQHPAVTGENYCKAINGAKVVLGLLRAANGDQSTDRSYEIGAIGGCGIYQDTKEHRLIMPEYPDEGFFRDPEELAQKVKVILSDVVLQKKLRSIGAKEIRKPENTYAARLENILTWSVR